MKIAILSDIHANLAALEMVIQHLGKLNCEHHLILGDMVGYYYEPKQVIDLIRKLPNLTVIKGNHEQMLLRVLEEPNFAKIYYNKYGSGLDIAREQLTENDFDWLKSLPTEAEIEINGFTFGLFHGSDIDINEYIYPDAKEQRMASFSDKYNIVLMGHTHYPVVFIRKKNTLINPGSVGQPRDVGSLASCAVVNTKNFAITIHRIPFDSKALRLRAQERDEHYPYLSDILKRQNIHAEG